ncbi:cytochrome c [Candidatus Solirubrobacter pratensis]|uniref:cytochrome c n=1 Tax=Candidatus Solirubrobacter pratensis TaxID=1298857 RepID=UPI0004056B67|nr:cytochrome c [Candidatus Solirubrobacter pratensis]
MSRRGGARRRRVLAATAVIVGAAAVAAFAQPGAAQSPPAGGRALFASACSACHGMDARGVRGKGPSLVGAGAAAADFYLETGRMPLSHPDVEPQRNDPAYTAPQRRALTAYIGSLGGPGIPRVDPKAGSVKDGFSAFTEHCAGCHAITAKGGVAPPGAAPALQQATATQIAEAVRVGPYLMPKFGTRQIDQHELDSITAYVLSTHHLPDKGGWGIGNIGPIPEGMVAWLLAGTALLIVVRLIGERI